MSAMKRMPDSDKPGKSNKPDGTPGKGRADKGKKYGKSEDRPPYKSRKPFKGEREDSDKPRPYKGKRDEKPSWQRDKYGDAPRERRFSDNPSGDRPYKSRKPIEGEGEGFGKSQAYKGKREEKPSWLRDKEGDAPRERRFSDKPTGDRPYKSRKPIEGEGEVSGKSRPYKGKREEKPSWLRDKEGDAPRERRFSDKPAGDRPYRGQRSDDAPYEPRNHRKSIDDRPQRPRKPEDESDAPRERRARTSDKQDGRSRRRDDGEFRSNRRYDDKDAPRKFGHGKSSDSLKTKGDRGYSKDGTIRLNKFIANSGVCSRREADRLIESGAVSVNGQVITELGTKITRDDKVQFDGQTLNIEKKVYLLLNKPKGYITTVDDPQERDTVMKLVKDACHERIYPVGRLDRNTTGLLLFTNDGEMAKKLTHPGHKVRKVYHVELDKGLTQADMDVLTAGVELEDGVMTIDEIAYTGRGDDKKNIGVVIHSGRNRIVRRLFEAIDYNVVKLDRVAFANLTKKDLPRGRWRMLEQSEINMLLMI